MILKQLLLHRILENLVSVYNASNNILDFLGIYTIGLEFQRYC